MELPNYRLPGAKNVAQLLWEKAKDFLQRAFSVILIATLVIWFLQSFDLHFNMVADSQDSILAMVAGVIAPVMRPLGLGDWRICTSLITGFMAKESVVSTLRILFGENIGGVLDTLSAAALLVFSLLYTPCVAAIASIRRELGGRWATSGGDLGGAELPQTQKKRLLRRLRGLRNSTLHRRLRRSEERFVTKSVVK